MKNILKYGLVGFAFFVLATFTIAQDAKTTQNKVQNTNWVDANGDGICDNVGTSAQNAKRQNKNMNKGTNLGTGQGLGNGNGDGTATRPQDGTGFGKKNGAGKGTGLCDGTGNANSGRKGSGRQGAK